VAAAAAKKTKAGYAACGKRGAAARSGGQYHGGGWRQCASVCAALRAARPGARPPSTSRARGTLPSPPSRETRLKQVPNSMVTMTTKPVTARELPHVSRAPPTALPATPPLRQRPAAPTLPAARSRGAKLRGVGSGSGEER